MNMLDRFSAFVANVKQNKRIRQLQNMNMNDIIENPRLCIEYARIVLKGRFEQGEEAIAQNALYSLIYAKDLLKERFIQGEKVISEDVRIKESYMKYFNIDMM